jgi:AcrR family transcriptional regulator
MYNDWMVIHAGEGHTGRLTKKDVVSEFRRGEILEAARRVFAGRGFAEATMEDIAREAGIAKGTIYLYYRSKGDVYGAAAEQGLRALHERVLDQVRTAGTAFDKVKAYISTKATYFEDNADFFRLYYAELCDLAAHSVHMHEDSNRLYLEQVEALEKGLAADFPDRVDLHSVCLAIGALTYGVITRRLRGWSTASLEDDIDSVVRFAWLGVAGR